MGWPTTSDPKTEFVTARFTVSESADLDAAASAAHLKRSAYVRDAVARAIAADKRAARKAALKNKKTGSP